MACPMATKLVIDGLSDRCSKDGIFVTATQKSKLMVIRTRIQLVQTKEIIKGPLIDWKSETALGPNDDYGLGADDGWVDGREDGVIQGIVDGVNDGFDETNTVGLYDFSTLGDDVVVGLNDGTFDNIIDFTFVEFVSGPGDVLGLDDIVGLADRTSENFFDGALENSMLG